MEWLHAYRDAERVGRLVDFLATLELPPVRFMEVCGTHTVAISRHGLRSLLPETIALTSGPGCPVCVTAGAEIDRFVKAAELDGVILATFGDLLRVPGSRGSLQEARSGGADVRPVYSTLDALALARDNPGRQVVFAGVGFETTAPTVAAALAMAHRQQIGNFSVLSAHKIMPPALELLASDPEISIDGLLCPGHVSVLIGAAAYRPLVEKYRIPCVIAGFEPLDILEGVAMLALQVKENRAEVEIAYRRAVSEEGNRRAMELLAEVFAPCGAEWRGLGSIEGSGLELRGEWAAYDAGLRFGLGLGKSVEPAGCLCGAVLRSVRQPTDCRLFGAACTPARPVGPCMVSSEGACAARYLYG